MRKALYLAGSILLLLVLVVVFLRPSQPDDPQRPISAAIADARAGNVSSITVTGNTIEVTTNAGNVYESRKEAGTSIYTLLEAGGVDTSQILIEVDDGNDLGGWLGLLLNFVPILLFVGLLIALIRAINRLNQRQ